MHATCHTTNYIFVIHAHIGSTLQIWYILYIAQNKFLSHSNRKYINLCIYVLSLYLISLLHCYLLFLLNMYRIALCRIVRFGLATKDEANKQTHLEYLYINFTRLCIFLSVLKREIEIFLFPFQTLNSCFVCLGFSVGRLTIYTIFS